MNICNTALEASCKELINVYEMDPVDLTFLRQFVVMLITACLTSRLGLSISDKAANGKTLWEDNKKTLILMGFIGAVCYLASAVACDILPLTIWFVMVSTLPFVDGILQFCFLGVRMDKVSIFVTAISFAIIVALTRAEDADDDVYSDDDYTHAYTLGIVLASVATITHAGMDLTTHVMQELNILLMLEYFSYVQITVFLGVMLAQFCITGQLPFAMVWSLESVLLLAVSILSCLVG